jgi:hypothetical protein
MGCAAAVTAWGSAAALPIDDFKLDGVKYDEEIVTPDAFFGHGLGDQPLRHDRFVDYLLYLSESSDRITAETIGYTHEGRPILFLVVSSPENQANIDELKAQHLASLEGEGEGAGTDKSVVWINYGVHGAESAGMDAAIPTVYHFAAAQGEEVEEMLDGSIVLITAILNPDGHSRRANHVETFMGKVPVTDPDHAQHDLWTEARTNHYWFDLNRQWLPVTQPESEAWVTKWQEWKPQVSADFHEMGSNSTFYFHPGEPKRLNPLIPGTARELTKEIAEYHREFLDEEGRLYFTEQGFDNFYVGKGSTYPQVNGSLGILFEIGAARGGSIESPNGLRDYGDNIRTHFRTSLTTIAGTLGNKDAIANYQKTFFEDAADAARRDPVKAYVFKSDGDRTRVRRFVELLNTHDIEVRKLAEDVQAKGMTFPAETSFVVPMDQKQYRMIRAMFDRLTEFEENIFYDVSGWTMPLAYDLDYAALGAGGNRRGVDGPYDNSILGAGVQGDDVAAPEAVEQTDYGYIMSWSDHYAPRALYQLLDEGLLVRAAGESFEVRIDDETERFPAGSLFIPAVQDGMEPDAVFDTVSAVSEDLGIEIRGVTSGAGDDATAALGGRSFSALERPEVLLVFDDGIARYDAGEIWHLLDNEMRMPVTLRRKDDLRGIDWSRYTHIIMPDGYGVAPAEGTVERMGQWVREEGGTLIAIERSAHWAQDTFLGTEEEAGDEGEDDRESPQRLDYSEMAERDAEDYIGGAIVSTDIDTSHPLGFGYNDRMLPMMRSTTDTLDWPKGNPYATAAAYPEDEVLLTGYMSERRQNEVSGTPAIIAQPVGRGQVILIADNPVFRGFFLGSSKVLTNAVFFSNLIDSPSASYEAVEE